MLLSYLVGNGREAGLEKADRTNVALCDKEGVVVGEVGAEYSCL